MLLPLLLLALAPAQSGSDRLPPANPVPYADADTATVMQPVSALLAGYAAGSGAAVLVVTRPEGRHSVATIRADGTHELRVLSWAEDAAALAPAAEQPRYRLADTAVESDGDVAMVWATYQASGGGGNRCGAMHVDLVRESGAWRVLNLTQSIRQDCAAP